MLSFPSSGNQQPAALENKFPFVKKLLYTYVLIQFGMLQLGMQFLITLTQTVSSSLKKTEVPSNATMMRP